VEQLDQSAGHLDAGRASTDDDDAGRADLEQVGTAVRRLELAQQMRPQVHRVLERLQAEGVLGNTGDAVGRGVRAAGNHELVVGDVGAVGGVETT